MNIQTIITGDPTGKALVDGANELATQLVRDGLKTAQIRTVFAEVRQIEVLWEKDPESNKGLRRLMMLKPKLAYQAARQNSVLALKVALSDAIDLIEREPDKTKRKEFFDRFVDFVEAVIAYHKD